MKTIASKVITNHVAAQSVLDDMLNSPEYAAFVEEMATHCRCTRDCPCAGVLAGGICDGLTNDDHDSLFDDPEDDERSADN